VEFYSLGLEFEFNTNSCVFFKWLITSYRIYNEVKYRTVGTAATAGHNGCYWIYCTGYQNHDLQTNTEGNKWLGERRIIPRVCDKAELLFGFIFWRRFVCVCVGFSVARTM